MERAYIQENRTILLIIISRGERTSRIAHRQKALIHSVGQNPGARGGSPGRPAPAKMNGADLLPTQDSHCKQAGKPGTVPPAPNQRDL